MRKIWFNQDYHQKNQPPSRGKTKSEGRELLFGRSEIHEKI